MCYLTTVALTSFLNARILHPISYNSFITKAEIQLKVRMCEFSSHITILLRPIILELFFLTILDIAPSNTQILTALPSETILKLLCLSIPETDVSKGI